MTKKNQSFSSSKIISLSGPSGVGKSSFIHKALLEFPSLKTTITYTTRKKRTCELDGASYFYINEEEFLKLIEKNFFIEWAKVHSFYYGTEKSQIEQIWKEGKVIILDVDIQGAFALKEKYKQILSIFIKPPSVNHLIERIKKRDSKEDLKDLKLRMNNAKKEIEKSKFFDVVILNDHFEKAYKKLKRNIDRYIKK